MLDWPSIAIGFGLSLIAVYATRFLDKYVFARISAQRKRAIEARARKRKQMAEEYASYPYGIAYVQNLLSSFRFLTTISAICSFGSFNVAEAIALRTPAQALMLRVFGTIAGYASIVFFYGGGKVDGMYLDILRSEASDAEKQESSP